MLAKLLGLFATLGYIVLKVLEQWQQQKNIQQGRDLRDAELAKEEIENNRKQAEILVQERSKEETTKRLEDGTF